jgi:hypothetical protein
MTNIIEGSHRGYKRSEQLALDELLVRKEAYGKGSLNSAV